MIRVSDIMIKDPVCCTPFTKIKDSKKLMQEHHCSKMTVVNTFQEKKIVGMVSLDNDEDEAIVTEYMSKEINVVEEDFTDGECLRVMILNNIEQVPVVDKQGHFCGIVTQTDLIKK